ncbi:MAG: hypothetical protein ACTHY0_07985, partial [Mammaliicoccus vitulinus]
IMLIIFALLFMVAYSSVMYVNSDKYNTLNIIVYMLAGLLAVRLSLFIDALPGIIMILYSIPLVLLKVRNNGDK